MKFEYDIAISFANEERNIAYNLANQLHSKYGFKVFYDDYEQAKLLGTDLERYLIDVFKSKARYCIILISKNYIESRWTNLEWKSALDRISDEPELDYILPIRIDNTELNGLLSTVKFIHYQDISNEALAELVNKKVSGQVELLKIIRLAEKYYLDNKFGKSLELVNDEKLDSEIEALRIRGNAYGKLHKYREAIDEFEKVVKILPDDFLCLFHLGIFYYRISDFKNSVKYYEMAEKIYPEHPTIKSDLPLARKKMKLNFIFKKWHLKFL